MRERLGRQRTRVAWASAAILIALQASSASAAQHTSSALRATSAPAVAQSLPAGPSTPPATQPEKQPPAACPVGRGRSIAIEFSGKGRASAYAVPAGEVFVVTDIIALREGNADGLLRLLADEQVVAILPLVGIDSATDLYGVHLVTGIPFSGGQTVALVKETSGTAWVTIVGYTSSC